MTLASDANPPLRDVSDTPNPPSIQQTLPTGSQLTNQRTAPIIRVQSRSNSQEQTEETTLRDNRHDGNIIDNSSGRRRQHETLSHGITRQVTFGNMGAGMVTTGAQTEASNAREDERSW